MSDRDEKRSERADAGREGFGDDQGTRIGSPTPGRERDGVRQPSHLSESLGEGDESERESNRTTGAGAEAAEGEHARGDRGERSRSALEDIDTGRSRPDEATVDRAGSEPLGREREHQSGYGGAGGAPKTSSDRREPLEPEGRADAR